MAQIKTVTPICAGGEGFLFSGTRVNLLFIQRI